MDVHLNWARKHRPSCIREYMGEEAKKKALARLSDIANYPRVIMLQGTRGGGKTSLSRIMSKEMLCEDKVDGVSCGVCDMCKELDENLLFADSGASTSNVMEVNAATDGGKKAVEEIMDEMEIEPMYGKFKICIIDEAQRLSTGSQNSLLKRLEEPNPWEIYMLCTTDPDDIITPIKSRCEVTITIRPAKLEELVERLVEICRIEGVKTSIDALKLLCASQDNNPRESILKLEDIAKSNGYSCTVENVMRETNSIASEVYMSYYTAVNSGLEDILRFTANLKERDIQPRDFIKGLTKFTLECMNLKFGIGIEKYQVEYIKEVKKFFNTYNTEEMDCLLQVIEYSNKMISSDESMGELLVNTTAMRIGKIKLLAVGLQRESELALAETKRGNKKAIDANKENSINKTVKEIAMDNALISSTFGRSVTEVKGEVLFDLVEEEEIESDGKSCSDDDLLKLFGG